MQADHAVCLGESHAKQAEEQAQDHGQLLSGKERRAALERSARPLLETWYFLLLGGGVSELTSSRIVINAAADCDAGGDDLRLPPAH